MIKQNLPKNNTPKQTPLGINVQSSFLQNIGLNINPWAAAHMGASRINPEYSFGKLVKETHLFWLTWSIHDAYNRGVVDLSVGGVYDNLIKIGQGVCEALGNAKPPTYNGVDPSDSVIPSGEPTWYNAGIPSGNTGPPATTGYGIAGQVGQGQDASWLPYTMANPNHSVTQWGFIRCWALQAWNEFNWNGIPAGAGMPHYKDFLGSFMTATGFVDHLNVSINALSTAQTYLKGVYSNMNDLTSADITGVSLATATFGQDCITAGKVIDLSKIDKFGMPSALLQTIEKNHAISEALNLALLSAGFTPNEVLEIAQEKITPSKEQEQKIYGSFLVISGKDLENILVPMNCKTKGLTNLGDLLNIKKLFPNSYQTITVPVYNTTPGPTNSKTYYPIYEGGSVSSRLTKSAVTEKVGTRIPSGEPPIIKTAVLRTKLPENQPTNKVRRVPNVARRRRPNNA